MLELLDQMLEVWIRTCDRLHLMAVLNKHRGYEVHLLDGLLERIPAHVIARYNPKMDTHV
jgi:hypothetical protein